MLSVNIQSCSLQTYNISVMCCSVNSSGKNGTKRWRRSSDGGVSTLRQHQSIYRITILAWYELAFFQSSRELHQQPPNPLTACSIWILEYNWISIFSCGWRLLAPACRWYLQGDSLSPGVPPPNQGVHRWGERGGIRLQLRAGTVQRAPEFQRSPTS